MARIFISYRREDSGTYARRLYERLASHFGDEHVFIDTDTIIPGQDFVRRIEETVDGCDVLLAVIGRTWLTATDRPGKGRRLDNPQDWVRLEIARALGRGIPIIPILIAGARMPSQDQLPAPISGLARRQAWELRDPGFRRIEGLLRAVEVALSEPQKRRTEAVQPPVATPVQASGIAEVLLRLAEEWDSALDQDPGGLLRGVRLVKVDQWARQQTQPLPAVARRFLEASLAARETEEAAERQGREAALRATAERKRLGLVLVLVSTFGPASAYYVGGLTEQMIGAAAPWFVLAVMLLACAARGLHAESQAVLGRGDVYTVVREGLGVTPAQLATFAFLFDYVLFASISTLAAAALVLGVANQVAELIRSELRFSFLSSTILASAFCGRIWRSHLVHADRPGLELGKLMPAAAAVFVAIVAWVGVTAVLWSRVLSIPPLPVSRNLYFSTEGLGWLRGTAWPQVPVLAILIALGHAMIAMSGDDTEGSRIVGGFKQRRFRGAVLVTFWNSFIFPAFVPFAAVLIVAPQIRAVYFDNILGGIAYSLAGPFLLRLAAYAAIAFTGVSVLLNAASTAMAAARLSLERAVADGAMAQWFRHSHPRYATPHRLLHLIFVLQAIALLASRGNLAELARVYAFGIGWGFTLKAVAVVALRHKLPQAREWQIPLNIRIGRHELPLGVALLALALFAIASVNLVSRVRATVCGASFVAIFFLAAGAAAKFPRRAPPASR